MKRTSPAILLIIGLHAGPSAGAQGPTGAFDISVPRATVVAADGRSRLCTGARNAIRAELAVRGAPPPGAVVLRLVLVVPGGDPGGRPLAEGSVPLHGPGLQSLTFLNVEVPERLRGRGARLEIRANADRRLPEADLSNNVIAIAMDDATDWHCVR
jgi:hypothetical protein